MVLPGAVGMETKLGYGGGRLHTPHVVHHPQLGLLAQRWGRTHERLNVTVDVNDLICVSVQGCVCPQADPSITHSCPVEDGVQECKNRRVCTDAV